MKGKMYGAYSGTLHKRQNPGPCRKSGNHSGAVSNDNLKMRLATAKMKAPRPCPKKVHVGEMNKGRSDSLK